MRKIYRPYDPRSPKNTRQGIGCMNAIIVVGVLLAFLAAGGYLTGQGSGSNSVAQQPVATETVMPTDIPQPATVVPEATAFVPPTEESMLATLESGQVGVNLDPVLVAQIAEALDQLGVQCSDSRSALGGVAVVIHDDMKKRGVEETYLSILQHVSDSIPAGTTGMSCAQVFAAYDVVRTDG